MAGVSYAPLSSAPLVRSTPKSRPNNLYMGLSCSSIRPYVRMSVRPQKVFPIPMKFGMQVEVDE